MVAPSLTFADSHSKDGHTRSSDDTALKAALEKHNHDAVCLVTPASIDASSEEGRHGNNDCNGDTKGFANHGTRVIKETQSNVEECGIYGIREGKEPKSNEDEFGSWENDAMCQEPTTKFTRRAHDMGTAQQPMEPIYVSINAVSAPKGKRVQWNDNHGKELVHVFEYAVSDTGESEEDEDDTDTTCTCTIQ